MKRLKERVCAEIDKLKEEVAKISWRIHENPEFGFKEYKASKWLASALEKGGFLTKLGTAGMETAIQATHPDKTEGPTIAILGEYDALPELGHACGHNLIAGAALGACLGLAPFEREIPGQLVFLGTPAEETVGGKVIMVKAGIFDHIDIAMMFHPSSRTVVDERSAASVEIEIEFQGKSAHAASSPELGIDALSALIQTFTCVDALRQHMKERTRIHGIVTAGGTAPNIITEYASARFTVRGINSDQRDKVVEKLHHCAEGVAFATGATLSFKKINQGYKEMRPNQKLAGIFTENLATLGQLLSKDRRDGMGATDMGDVSQIIPAIEANISICSNKVVTHSREFAQAAISNRGSEVMIKAAKALAMTAIDVAIDVKLLQEIRGEFSKANYGKIHQAEEES